MLPHFGVLVLAGAAGDATGDGVATGLAVVAGAFSTGATVGAAAAGDGLGAVGVVSVAGSHPAASRIEESVNARIAVRLITVLLVIDLCLVSVS